MPAIPRSLEDLSLDLLVKNVQAYADEKEAGSAEEDGPVDGRHPFFSTPPYSSSSSSAPPSVASAASEEAEPMELSPSPPPQPQPRPLPAALGNKLLRRVRAQDLLRSSTAPLFRRSFAHLSHVNLSDTSLRDEDLGFLSDHSLVSLQLRDLPQLNLPKLLADTLSRDTKAQLKLLDISYSFPKGSAILPALAKPKKYLFGRGIGKRGGEGDGEDEVDSAIPPTLRQSILALESLEALKMAGTALDNSGLRVLATSLPNLATLDISLTEVSDLTPLSGLAGQLRNLILFNTPVESAAVLVELEALEVLDISDSSSLSPTAGGTSGAGRGALAKTLLLEAQQRFHRCSLVPFPLLRVLDASGLHGNVNGAVLSLFLRHHPQLRFLGLIKNSLRNASDELREFPLVEVAGDGSVGEILAGLRLVSGERDGGCRWREREAFLSAQLHAAFSELHSNYEGMGATEGQELLRLVLRAMGGLRSSVGIQMAGTACLYNLCRSQRAEQFPAAVLGLVVTRCLDALEGHPSVPQLAKNVWLTLCNDLILQTGQFDLYRCCQLALESMVLHPDEAAITRMTVAIVSILAAKIPIQRTTTLGANARYMDFMLNIVSSKLEEHYAAVQHQPQGAEAPPPDVTLKFTLSALWNLTDESPGTSEQFLHNKGLDVVLRVLETYKDQPSIQTKILGLLNNVAEVPGLKQRLANHAVLKEILWLLGSQKIEVSYFAAGILAHLCVGEPWETRPTRGEALEELEKRIAEWGRPENEMVAYRSFRPFFPLLARPELPGVQLWAVWAVRHVCAKSRSRYLPLFLEEEGHKAVQAILDQPADPSSVLSPSSSAAATQALIRSLCQEILAQIRQHSTPHSSLSPRHSPHHSPARSPRHSPNASPPPP